MDHLHQAHTSHEHSLRQELICHLPYASFSVALGIIVLSIFYFLGTAINADQSLLRQSYHLLFHTFHYVHLVFAIAGTIISFSRFSSDRMRCLLVSLISPAIFCTLSDVALPTLAGRLLGIDVDLHICFFSLPDLANVLPFMMVGLITGFAICAHNSTTELKSFSLHSHFTHILIASLAASFYIASYDVNAWHPVMGMLFLFLVIAVIVPCTIADVVVPLYCARWKSCS